MWRNGRSAETPASRSASARAASLGGELSTRLELPNLVLEPVDDAVDRDWFCLRGGSVTWAILGRACSPQRVPGAGPNLTWAPSSRVSAWPESAGENVGSRWISTRYGGFGTATVTVRG